LTGARVQNFAFALFFCLLALTGCGKEESRSISGLGSGTLRWESFPIPLKVDSLLYEGGPSREDLRIAIAFWEKRADKSLFQTSKWPTGVVPFTGPALNPESILENAVFFQSPWPFEANVAGKTFLHSNNGVIQKAVIFLNAETRLCGGDCSEEPEQTSREKLLAHELGHALGFAHVSDPKNIMYPQILPGDKLDELTVDMDLLKNLTK
jgi:hypothetical protein